MQARNRFIYIHRFVLAYLSMSMVLGVALIVGNYVLGFLAIGLQFLWFQKSHQVSWRSRIKTLYFGNVIFMMTVMSWYRGIDAHGWDTILGLPPSVVLLSAVFMASLFCSLFVVACWLIIYGLLPNNRRHHSLLLLLFAWTVGMLTSEIARSWAFSLVAVHSEAPVAPTWNIYSIAILASDNVFSWFGQYVGFWGLSWLICIICGGLILLLQVRKTVRVAHLITMLVCVSLVLVSMVSLTKSKAGVDKTFHVVAVSQSTNQPNYLENLSIYLAPASDVPTVVVLPEYSNLRHPFANTGVFSLNYDARYSYPEKFSDKNIYFVGTEDEYARRGRYVESYVVDGSLQKVKRQNKTFLIPGGEYVVPWAGKIIGAFDPQSVGGFSSVRGRNVFSQQLQPEKEDKVAKEVGIGACSALLLPYHFQKEVKNGALFLTSNVSYEQFVGVPEYERYATRFAKLYAVGLKRWFVIGARGGDARIISPQGQLTKASNGSGVIQQEIVANSKLTPYAKLGDKSIVFAIIFASLFWILYKRYKTGGKLVIESYLPGFTGGKKGTPK